MNENCAHPVVSIGRGYDAPYLLHAVEQRESVLLYGVLYVPAEENTVTQQPGESLEEYTQRFIEARRDPAVPGAGHWQRQGFNPGHNGVF